MLIKRGVLIALLMLVGFIIASVSTWSLAFDMHSNAPAAWSGHWILERLPILIGVLLVIGGFRLLSATRVARVADDPSDPAP